MNDEEFEMLFGKVEQPKPEEPTPKPKPEEPKPCKGTEPLLAPREALAMAVKAICETTASDTSGRVPLKWINMRFDSETSTLMLQSTDSAIASRLYVPIERDCHGTQTSFTVSVEKKMLLSSLQMVDKSRVLVPICQEGDNISVDSVCMKCLDGFPSLDNVWPDYSKPEYRIALSAANLAKLARQAKSLGTDCILLSFYGELKPALYRVQGKYEELFRGIVVPMRPF